MSNRMIADCAPVHRSETPTEASVCDTQLDSAVSEAGQHPERAAALAVEIGIGRESIVHQALRGVVLPPPIWDEHWDPPPAGSFDAGVARVMGEQYVIDFEMWAVANKARPDFPTRDVTAELQAEVRRSYGFARYAMMLASGIRLAQEEGDSEDDRLKDAEKDISRMAAVAFYAGWLMAMEYVDAQSSARSEVVKVCGAERGHWICNLAANHSGQHEAWGENAVGHRWSGAAVEQGGAR